MQTIFNLLTVAFFVASLVLVLIILLQRPQGGGLAAAFGGSGGGGGDTAFGGKTGDVLTVTTVSAFALYLLLAIGLNIMDRELSKPQIIAPPAEAAPATSPGAPPMTGTFQPTDPATGAPAGSQPIEFKKLDGPPPGVKLPSNLSPTPANPPATTPPASTPPASAPPASTPPASTPPATPPSSTP